MTTEIIYTWPDGREEVRYRLPKDSSEALSLITEVLSLQQRHKDACPYSFRHVNEESVAEVLRETKGEGE